MDGFWASFFLLERTGWENWIFSFIGHVPTNVLTGIIEFYLLIVIYF